MCAASVQLARLNNKRLKLGDIRSDDGTITADVVTLDNSLVQRLKVDRALPDHVFRVVAKDDRPAL